MKLALFFTRGISLKYWIESGLFEREKIIYENFINKYNIEKVIWFTYGYDDKFLAKELKKKSLLNSKIYIKSPPKIFDEGKISSLLYSFLIPFLFLKEIKNCNILMTNQIDGWWTALISKIFSRKKLIVRAGYIQSQLENNLKRISSFRIKLIMLSEKLAINYSDNLILASKHNLKYLNNVNNNVNNKACVIPNFIQTTKFYSKNIITKRKFLNRILYVGRLSNEKNLLSLLKAIKKSDLGLDIYGDGDLKKHLKLFTTKNNIDVNFFGKVPNSKLPEIYNSYQFCILPSFFEGMPKTLLEAMSCGCISIGSNIEGINQIIKDGKNGILIKSFKYEDIFLSIEKVKLMDNKTKINISKKSVNTINEYFSLDVVSKSYLNIFLKNST